MVLFIFLLSDIIFLPYSFNFTVSINRKVYNFSKLVKIMLTNYIKLKERNQYDEFLHKIQQPKMKELWDNKEDDVWENV